MGKIELVTGNGKNSQVDESTVEQFGESLRGELLQQGDAGYDDAREVWNAMIDKRPTLIARCTGAADVMQSVRFASEHGALVAVRGAGHNIAGNAVCDGGLVIDLSLMKTVRVDPEKRRAHVSPGATLGDLDHETQAFGLATPVGINTTTGIAGLTLGGGFGWLSRKHGMTVDNLVAADVVTAEGKLVRASEKENADLFWALRGGGGNFGIVTRFEFELHPVGPEVYSGLIAFPLSEAKTVFQKYREFVAEAPDELSVWCVLRKAPPLPFLPEDVHGTEIIVLAMCYIGDPNEGAKLIEPVRSFGNAHGEHIGVMPFTAWQGAFDPLLTPGARNYWKSHNFTEIDDDAIDIVIDYTGKLPDPQTEIFIGHLGGQMGRVAADATAYPHRDANFVMNVHGRWDNESNDDKCIKWARDLFKDTTPHATGGVYINFMTEDETDRVRAAYGPGYDRLTAVKKQYDPNNLFRLNQNISPKG
jgi:FAD/FMN-containing dehydrogenase